MGIRHVRAPAPKVDQTPLRRLPRLTRSFIGTVRYHPSSVSLICLKHPVRMMPNWPTKTDAIEHAAAAQIADNTDFDFANVMAVP